MMSPGCGKGTGCMIMHERTGNLDRKYVKLTAYLVCTCNVCAWASSALYPGSRIHKQVRPNHSENSFKPVLLSVKQFTLVCACIHRESSSFPSSKLSHTLCLIVYCTYTFPEPMGYEMVILAGYGRLLNQ